MASLTPAAVRVRSKVNRVAGGHSPPGGRGQPSAAGPGESEPGASRRQPASPGLQRCMLGDPAWRKEKSEPEPEQEPEPEPGSGSDVGK